MPYKTTAELPASVRSALPAAAQSVFMRVANDRLASGQSDESAFRQAWHAVGQGWHKDKNGTWTRNTEKAAEAPTWRQAGYGRGTVTGIGAQKADDDPLFAPVTRKYRPDQARDDHGRFADEGGGGGTLSAVVRSPGGKKPKGTSRSSIKELTQLYGRAKTKRTKLRTDISSLQTRMKRMKAGTKAHTNATTRLKALNAERTALTREMKRLSDIVARRRGKDTSIDFFTTAMTGWPSTRSTRRGLKRARSDDLFDRTGL